MILFRGREQSRPEQGVRLLRKFAEDVAEFGTVESNPTIDGRNMVMVIGPLKNKSTAKAEARGPQRSANEDYNACRQKCQRKRRKMPKQKTHSGARSASRSPAAASS